MLVQKSTLSANDVAVMKLPSGEEVLAKVVSMDETSITVTKPTQLVIAGVDQQGNAQVAMTPFMMAIEETGNIRFNLSQIVMLAKARKDAADQYTATTSSIRPAQTLPEGLLRG